MAGSDPYARRRHWGVLLMGIAVLVAGSVSLSVGAVDVGPSDVAGVLAARVGLDWFGGQADQAEAVVWGIRMPRMLMGFVVGAGLAVSGVVLQGMLRSEVADPQILGIGPGAAIGAAFGAGVGGVQGAISGGVAAGVLTSLVVQGLRRRSIDRTRLILSGVALGAALSAWVGFVVFASDRAVTPPIEFWLLGGLTGSTWRSVGTTTILLLIALGALLACSRALDLLVLGDKEAWHLGVDVDLATSILFIVVGAAVGVTVGAVGVVVFVGLLVPFLMRRLVGPIHRHLIPAAVLGGGLFLICADLVARVLMEPVEIPVGLVTAVIGGPLFLWQVSRRRDV